MKAQVMLKECARSGEVDSFLKHFYGFSRLLIKIKVPVNLNTKISAFFVL